MDHFGDETVVAFLEYLYSETVKSAKTLALIQKSGEPKKYIFKRPFDEEKLTLELLSMAKMYHVEDLEMDCTEHLKATLTDDNVMKIWKEAKRNNYEGLCEMAIVYLVERPKGKTLQEVSGLNETFQDLPQPQKDFLNDLLNKLTERNAQLKENQSIKITVENSPRYGEWEKTFTVKHTEKVETFLKETLENKKPKPYGREWRLTLNPEATDISRVERHLTFLENSINIRSTCKSDFP